MTHPLVSQLRFTRGEWQRALRDISEADARIRFDPMNSISWIVGHLAWHEHLYWFRLAQERELAPHLDDLVGTGKPASSPYLKDMMRDWRQITTESDAFLNTLTSSDLVQKRPYKGKELRETTGTMIQRLVYHYWFHMGEILAIRQLLGHSDLPEFVGDISGKGPYRREEQT